MLAGSVASRSLGINAGIIRFHERNGLTDEALAGLPPGLDLHAEQDFGLIGNVFSEPQLADVGDEQRKHQLARKTVAGILSGTDAFVPEKSKQNPKHFIAEGSRLTNKQKTTVIIERPSYDRITEAHSFDTFTTGQSKQIFSKDGVEPKRHNYDYVNTDFKN